MTCLMWDNNIRIFSTLMWIWKRIDLLIRKSKLRAKGNYYHLGFIVIISYYKVKKKTEKDIHMHI